jgi:hypothetical protein
MFKKKFKEEDDQEPTLYSYNRVEDTEENTRENPISAKKEFKLKENVHDEMEFLLKNKKEGKFSSSNKIHDFRFFDLQNYNSKVLVFINHKNPNQNIMKLLKEISSTIINAENLSENKYSENLSEMEQEIIILDSIMDSREINSLKISLQSNPKVIIYLDTEKIDLEVFLILHILKKFKNSPKFQNLDIIIMSDETIIFPLHPGMNTIFLSRSLFTKHGLGLIPLEKSSISTKGLRWDVSKWETNFGFANLSTSNEFLDEESQVIVESGSLVITAEIDPDNIVFL